MLQLILESINQSFVLIVGVLGYWFLWVCPAITIGQELVTRIGQRPVNWLAITLNLAIFIVFAFPSVLLFVLYFRYFTA